MKTGGDVGQSRRQRRRAGEAPLTLVLLLSLSGHAEPIATTAALPDPGEVQVHGLVSQGFILSTGSNYLAESMKGSFEFSEAALNASIAPTDTLTIGMQLFTRDLGPIGNYTVKFDWFQLDWHPSDVFGIRAGRVRMPFGLYNTISDYDPARVSVLLPSSLYPTTSRDYLLAVTGGAIYGVFDLGPVGHLNYSGYGGAIYIDPDTTQGILLDVPYTTGGQLLWETPVPGLSLAGSVLAAELDGTIPVVDPKLGTVTGLAVELPAVLAVASLQYLRGGVVVAAEYLRQHSTLHSDDQSLYPDTEQTGEGYYVLATVETTEWLTLGAYYSASFPDVRTRDELTSVQHDVAATLRFDVNPYWLLKLEGHYMHGVGATLTTLNDTAIEDRPTDWAVGLVKTTAYF